MKKLCSLAEGVVRFRVNYNIKKELQVRIRKKRKERWSNQLPMALDWKEKCLALATRCTTSYALILMYDQILLFSSP